MLEAGIIVPWRMRKKCFEPLVFCHRTYGEAKRIIFARGANECLQSLPINPHDGTFYATKAISTEKKIKKEEAGL